MINKKSWLLFFLNNRSYKIIDVKTNKQVDLWQIYWSDYNIINKKVYKGTEIIENLKII